MRRARTHVAVAIALLPLLAGVQDAAAQNVPDLVTADVLRVCGDPGNMPFSERKEDGFENRIAAIIADELKIKVRYYWLTQGPGFVRNTLGTGLCDLIVGSALGSEGVQNTNPYYRSVYTLIVKQGDLAGVTGLDDPRLKGKRIGVIAGTPPVNRMGDLGLISSMKAYAPYQLDPARKNQTVGAEIVSDLAAGQIDAAVLWGPSAGWLAKQSGTAMDVIPLLKEPDRPPMSYRIAMAVRIGENDWKRSLNTILRKRRSDIEAVLRDFDVPLLEEEENKLLAPNAH
ncbi:rare earth element methanol dehydrogenase accessory protein XoxJ [Methylobacterium sp. J-092]|uniref:rare earth element methanol dehydrogenase accessory protein XoxJ n=1 Tax=Methylobacterium sp. J-092 TaxID=2836667 RepID=UPI001FB92A62|nr:rare earth element methanol dehydrogenase accessory protein XoxJ [Methylobacterium sp. J-092]MCJ2010632.1 substrate-binding domain-containing protein [Methylobacterium sp. J-092]